MRSGTEETLNKPEPAGIVRRALAFASACFPIASGFPPPSKCMHEAKCMQQKNAFPLIADIRFFMYNFSKETVR